MMIVIVWSFAFWKIMEDHRHDPSMIIVMHEDGRVMMMVMEDHDNDDGRS